MPRKKTKKVSNKRNTTKMKSFVDMKKMENDFVTTPSKLAAIINKDINAFKQQISKLQSALKKAAAFVAAGEKKVKSASTKKQTSVAKKSLAEAKSIQSTLNKQLTDTHKLLDNAVAKHAKFNAISKVLSQFEKDWKKKPVASKVKSASKPKMKKRAKAPVVEIAPMTSTMTDNSVVELNNFEPEITNDIRRDGSNDA